MDSSKDKKGFEFTRSKKILAVIILIYTIVSFIGLGSSKGPKTFKTFNAGDAVFLRIPNDVCISKISVYVGDSAEGMSIFLYNDESSWYYFDQVYDYCTVFKWNDVYVNESSQISSSDSTEENSTETNISDNDEQLDNSDNEQLDDNGDEQIVTESGYKYYKYILLQTNGSKEHIGEIAAYDQDGNLVNLTPEDQENDGALVDEQSLAPDTSTYMNSTYFDEIYYVKSAYQQLVNIEPYESTHPPLGKNIIAYSISLFGVNPFAYRLMGNIAGILVILVMYGIGKTLFKKERYGVIAAAIMALDGMHFVQTRIATVDSFVLLFSLCAFLFMMKYVNANKDVSFKKKMGYLAICGVFVGCDISTKWNSAFVIIGLAVIFIVNFIYDMIKNKPNKNHLKTIPLCVLFFVVIPAMIYLISYLPLYFDKGCSIKSWATFIDYQKAMYMYHSTLNATHPFTSSWYTWPIMYKPMWYYSKDFADGTYSTISCMGNPIIWWAGALATIVSLVYTIIARKKEALPLIVMIITTWLSYIFIGRIMFIYHYIVTLPFVMLMLVYALKLVEEKTNKKIFTTIFMIVALIFFMYFYPVYSGMRVPKSYIEQTKWFSSWIY